MSSVLLDQLSKWGCDVPGAMERFLDDEDLYLSCLDIFAEDENFAKLRQSLDSKNYTDAFDSAHTLKGVSGNLGLSPLYQAVVEIVEPLRSKDYSNLEAQYSKVINKYDEFMNILNTYR